MRDAGTFFAIAAVAAVVLAGTVLRGASLLLVVLACVAGFVASGAEALAWLWFVFVLPALVAAACLGWGLRPARGWVPAALVALAAAAVGGAVLARRATLAPVPAEVARELPHDAGTLSTFCFAELPERERRTARRRTRALVRELGRRPEGLVEVEYDLAESPGTAREDRTVSELAEETLDSASCPSPEASALRAALDAAG